MGSKGGEEGRTPVSLEAGVNRESGPSDSETLCNFCKRTFNFGLVGFKHTSSILIRRRPIRFILKELKTCLFCRELAEFYCERSGGKLDKDIFDLQDGFCGKHWVDFSLHKEKSLVIDDVLNNRDVDSTMASVNRIRVLFNNPDPDSCNFSPLLQFQYCSQPPLQVSNDGSLYNWEKSGPEQAYSGRIRPLVADTRLFREWKKTCCAEHGDPCNLTSTGTRPSWLRLIDVKERCVVDVVIKDDTSYAVLSYVWGKHELDQCQKLMPELGKSTENRFREPRSLTRETVLATIDDAIEVAQSLGEKYLWVDCLCIRQDDNADQGKFILQMDSIYAYASVTIVAASGGNADAGLPGIKPKSRSREQKPFRINGVSLLRTLDPEGSGKMMSDDYRYLEDSVWCERGWTFQEKIFSRRALIFTKEQVYWECQKATWCEDGFWETMQPPTIYRSCFNDHFRRPWPSDTKEGFEGIYLKLVMEYCRRKLTKESDGLDAFRGILNALEREAGQDFLWALPTSLLSKMLMWCCDERSIKSREEMCPVRSSDRTTYCPFPSWSWVGWLGVVQSFNTETSDLIFYYLDGEQQLKRADETDNAQCRSKDAERTDITLEDIPESVLSQSIASNILFFWSTTAKLHVRHEGRDWAGHDKLILSRNEEDVMCSWSHTPDLKQGDKELAEFVVIGNEVYNRIAILLVDWKDGVAYRRGLATLDAALWEGLDNLEWKIISLG